MKKSKSEIGISMLGIGGLFDEIYLDLKEEFKKYPVIVKYEKKGNVLADCNYITNPPTINVYIGTIQERINQQIKENLKSILTHELIHAIQPPTEPTNQKENDAYGKMNKLKFFKDVDKVVN